MISREEFEKAQAITEDYLTRAGIILTLQERTTIEVADFAKGDLATSGLQIVVYINTPRCCAKELVMTPHQTCPEHRHQPVGNDPGKEETFRCRWGEVFLYTEEGGEPTTNPRCQPPAQDAVHYTVFHETVLRPGEQFTIAPNIKHWFQAGKEGAVVSEFSTTSRDEFDIFTDPGIVRAPEVA